MLRPNTCIVRYMSFLYLFFHTFALMFPLFNFYWAKLIFYPSHFTNQQSSFFTFLKWSRLDDPGRLRLQHIDLNF